MKIQTVTNIKTNLFALFILHFIFVSSGYAEKPYFSEEIAQLISQKKFKTALKALEKQTTCFSKSYTRTRKMDP